MPSSRFERTWGRTWRATLIALAYALGLVVAGGLVAALGWPLPARGDSALVMTLLGGACMGLTLTLIFWRIPWSVRGRFAIGACAVLFTMLSTTIEGAFFAPALVGSLQALVLLDLLAALAVGSAASLGSTPVLTGATRAFS
jgi:hypothetical protein